MPAYFLERYCQVYDATARVWLPFGLWPAQRDVLIDLEQHRLTVILKARQLGLSWLVVGWALWLMLFQPAATVLFFSKRDQEAVHLLAFRLRGMLDRSAGLAAAGAGGRQRSQHRAGERVGGPGVSDDGRAVVHRFAGGRG